MTNNNVDDKQKQKQSPDLDLTYRVHDLQIVGLIGHVELVEGVSLGGDLGSELSDPEAAGHLGVELIVDVLHGDVITLLAGPRVQALTGQIGRQDSLKSGCLMIYGNSKGSSTKLKAFVRTSRVPTEGKQLSKLRVPARKIRRKGNFARDWKLRVRTARKL